MLRQLFAVCAAASVTLVACGGSAPTDLFTDVDASLDGSTSGDGSSTTRLPDGATVLPSADGGTLLDGSPGGTSSVVSCGSTTCKIPSEICCVARGGGGSFSYACAPAGTVCPVGGGGGGGGGGVGLTCTGAANCTGGTVCCVSQANNLTTSSCKATCSGNDAQLCDPAAVPTGCSPQAPCSNKQIADWQLPPSFGTCGGKGN